VSLRQGYATRASQALREQRDTPTNVDSQWGHFYLAASAHPRRCPVV